MGKVKLRKPPKKIFQRHLVGLPLDKMPKGPNGRRLCRWCQKEVPKGRITFCGSKVCSHEYQLRSNPSYMRTHVEKRDKGVCAKCKLNTTQLAEIFNRLLRRSTLKVWPYHIDVHVRHSIRNRYVRAEVRLERLYAYFPWAFDIAWLKLGKYFPKQCSLWQADHIIPVAEGGGQCGLENMRTLCIGCHVEVTKELRQRLTQRKGKR